MPIDRSKFRYLVVTGTSFTQNLLTTFLLVGVLGVPPLPAYAISLVTVFLTNFHLVRYWVYPERVADITWARQFVPFLLSSLLFRGAEWIIYAVLVDLGGFFYLGAVVVVQVAFFIVKFLIYDRVIFNPRKRGAS